MSDHAPRTIERHTDVAVIGGTADLFAKALQLCTSDHSVIIVDPGALDAGPLADGREAVRRHGGEVLAGRATDVTTTGDGRNRVALTGGHSILSRHVLTVDSPEDEFAMVLRDDRRGDTSDDSESATASANEVDWDRRYSDLPIWSGNPNGTLVAEVDGMQPGRALDVGAGEGGDAIWLAEQGWKVTASDVARRALDRIEAEASRRGLHVDLLHADANAPDAFGQGTFDLVCAQYASIPRTIGDRAVHNLLRAVAPGGTLLVITHDPAPMRTPIDTSLHSRMFDPDAYVRTDDVAAVIAGSSAWDIEVHGARPRPPGAVSASHHVDDVVLRARRRE